MLEAVTIAEIEKIFAVTDRMGIHRELLVIPLLPRNPGRVRRMPSGKLEIIVDGLADFESWITGLEDLIRVAQAGTQG